MQDVNQEIDAMYVDNHDEKEQYEEQLRELERDMALKELVIDLFVPEEEVKKVTRDARWNAEAATWSMEPRADVKRSTKTAKRPVSASGLRRPTTEFTKTANAMGDLNPRFRSENILSLELDMPERTTFDYLQAAAAGDVQQALDMAFPAEQDVMFVGDDRVRGVYVDPAAEAAERPQTSGKSHRPTRTPSGRQRPSSARRK